jgi:predicted metal-dependent hydrolase
MAAALTNPGDGPVVEVRRSRKRRRTVAAYREDDKVVVLVPARFTRAEEREWVATMVARLERSEKRRRPSDAGLVRRAAGLNAKYLDGLAEPRTVRWVANQNSRWGSCTPSDRSIRLSTRLQGMPAWVIDYVLVHELAHLLEAGHTPEFWGWVDRFPKAERAKGFLEGVAAASQLGLEADPPDCSDEGAAQMARDDDAEVASGVASGVEEA